MTHDIESNSGMDFPVAACKMTSHGVLRTGSTTNGNTGPTAATKNSAAPQVSNSKA